MNSYPYSWKHCWSWNLSMVLGSMPEIHWRPNHYCVDCWFFVDFVEENLKMNENIFNILKALLFLFSDGSRSVIRNNRNPIRPNLKFLAVIQNWSKTETENLLTDSSLQLCTLIREGGTAPPHLFGFYGIKEDVNLSQL